MKVTPLTVGMVKLALEGLPNGVEASLPVDAVSYLSGQVQDLQLQSGVHPTSRRRGLAHGATLLAIEVRRFAGGSSGATSLGFEVAREWLRGSNAWLASNYGRARRAYESAVANTDAESPAVEAVEAALAIALADPLLVFLAGPITGASMAEAEDIQGRLAPVRADLEGFRVHVYAAPSEADPRVHSYLADHDCWRDHDESWIRHSDLVAILHTRPASGLGCVAEIAHSADVPVLMFSEVEVTPMLRGPIPERRRAALTDVSDEIVRFIADNHDAMLGRRARVRRNAQERWRPGRLRLRKRISALSTEGLAEPAPTTMTRRRVDQILNDDYAFGSVTGFEQSALRALISGTQLPELPERQSRALVQAASNSMGKWPDEARDYLEIVGREQLADAAAGSPSGTAHYSSPASPRYWTELYESVFGTS